MSSNNNIDYSKPTWRIWLIKKLLTKRTSKDDILRILNEMSDSKILKNPSSIDDNNQNSLINNILNLSEKNVENVMVPRAEIISVEANQDMKSFLSIIKNQSHSRMPVYKENLDNILGFVHIKDVIKTIDNNNFNIKKILRQILYVAPKSPILELLKRMRSSRIHMALVVDEFGGVDGLVTIEDLVEEIVGEIEDEHDAEDNTIKFKKINNNKIIVDASYKLVDLEKYYNINIVEIKEEEIDTVGGLTFFLAGQIPKERAVHRYKDQLILKILSASNRRVHTIEIDRI